MLSNIRITGHQIIEDAIFIDLPRITVICGPNNSGKSTLLSAIMDEKFSITGQVLNNDDVDEIFKKTIGGTGWRGTDNYVYENSKYREIISEVVAERKIWFLDDETEFSQKVVDSVQDSRLRRWQFNGSQVASTFAGVLRKTVSSVLIPPKRTLELITNIKSGRVVKSNGIGLLNFLFAAKNQQSTSENKKLYDRIYRAFIKISDGFRFEIFISDENQLSMQFSPREDVWLHAEDCGLGLQDLLIILYFSEAQEINNVCIEEPESHLHPDMQRRLLVYLNQKEDRQFFITTHSNVFLNNALVDKVLVTKSQHGHITAADATSRASVLDDLGYSVADNLVSDLVVLVEGPTDVPVLEELFVKKGLLEDYEIKIWPLGGDIMDQLDLDVLSESYRLIALLDKDPGSSKVRNRFAEKCKEKGIPLTILKRYAIENYFTIESIKSVFGTQIPENIKNIDSNKKLESQIGINVKKNNRKITRELNLNDLKDTDLYDFLTTIETICHDEH